MERILHWLILVLAVNIVFCANGNKENVDDTIVVTKRGPIKGQSEDGYSTFLGVPYALVDENNPFGASLKYPHFENPFNASDPNIKCPQVIFNEGGTIQCLTLNIYVPKSNYTIENKLPVFVWFYGGGFVFGSAGIYDGKLLVKHDIIVVTVNYRLGPYGFLCLDNSKIPGNQGLKDQIDALRWINENIEAFGGNNKQITIAGESYGGGAVDLHLFSHYETLFNKAIVQSGGAEVRRMFVKPDYQAPIKIAKHLGHNTDNNQNALNFLNKADPIEVMRAALNLSMILTVCKEKKFKGVANFITEDQFHLKKPDRIKNTSILIGYNSKETFNDYANKTDDGYANANTFINDDLKEIFNMEKKEISVLSKIIHEFYLGAKLFNKDAMLELVDLSGDFILNRAAESSVTRYIEQGAPKVFKYLFSYVGGSPFKDIPGVGAFHTEELQYLFDSFGDGKPFSDEQIMIRDRMTTMWSNFVKYGDPTPEVTDLLPVPWVPVTGNGARPCMNIDVNMTIMDHVYHDRIAFWDLFWRAYWKKAKVVQKK